MIKYNLKCKDCKNQFDSWFASSREYEKLKKLKHLSCDNCNSLNVEKTLMAPSVLNSKNQNTIELKDNKYFEIKKKIKEYQKFIKKNLDYVGDNFVNEARSLHYDEKKKSKGIYGKASPEEIIELKEEGIETEVVPWFKYNEN